MFILLLLSLIYAGKIDTLDYQLDFLNVGYTRSFTFTFKLESGLGLGAYLSLKLPFILETTLISQVPQGVSVIYKEVSSTDCSPISQFPGNIFKDSTGYYHIQFLNLDRDPRILEKNTYYSIQITTTSNLINQIAQINSPIEAMTIQDYQSLPWLYYDFNRVFAQIEFTDPPPNTLLLTAKLLSPTPKLLDFRHNIQIRITPTVFIPTKSRIMIRMTDQDYLFSGQQCSSDSFNKTDPLNFPEIPVESLNSSLYQCTIQNNVVIISLYQTFNDTLQFSFTIRNPKFIKTNSGFEVLTLRSYANNILETGSLSNQLETQQLNWGLSNANLVTYFAWGLSLSDSTIPSLIAIYRANPDNPFYNSFKFTFYPSANTPLNLQLKITLSLNADVGSKLLEGSLFHNLPQFDTNPVQCKIIGTLLITCENVGTLTTTTIYYILIKMYLPYLAVPIDLPSDFGIITVYTYDNGAYHVTPLIVGGRDTTAIYSTKIYTTFTAQQSQNGYTLAHSQLFSLPLAAVTNSNYGLHYTSDEQRIVFTINIAQSNFLVSSVYPIGVDIYTSPTVIPAKSTPIAESTLGTFSNTPGSLTNTALLETTTQYTRMRAGVPDLANLNNVFAPAVASLKQFSIGPFYITNNGTQYCSEQLIDFFGKTSESVFTTNTQVKIFISNAYTMSSTTQMNNLYLSMVNFWTSTGVDSLDGTRFPALIRVTGYLDAQEIANVSRLAVFFTNLIPYDEGSTNDGKTYASCSSSLNNNQKCLRYLGDSTSTQSLYHLSRVEFLLDDTISRIGPASPFQLLIPVATMPNKNKIFLQIAAIKDSENTILQFVKNTLFEQTFSATANFAGAQNAGITAMQYSLDITTAPVAMVGSTNQDAIIKYGHTDSGTTVAVNTGSSQGAGFFYQGGWNMIGDQFHITAGTITNQAETYSKKCLPYHYNQINGFYCPINQGPIISSGKLYISGFNYPSSSISLPTGTYAGFSTNTGQLVSYLLDSQVATLTPGSIVSTGVTQINKGYGDQIIKWMFRNSNSIPKDGYIEVKFSAGTVWTFTIDTTSKCYLQSSSSAIQITHTCQISKIDGLSIKFSLFASKNFPADNYQILHYGVTQPQIDGSSVTYTMGVFSNAGVLIDQSGTGAFTLIFNNVPASPSVELSNLIFERSNQQLRGQFSFDFKLISRGLLYNQKLVIELSMLNVANPAGKFYCKIKDSFDFKTMDLSSLNTITIKPVGDLEANILYSFQCENIITPNTFSSPIVKILSNSGTILFQSSLGLTYNLLDVPIQISSTGFELKKYLNQASTMFILEIQMSLSYLFDSTSTIYVNLPYYFNSYDNRESFTCSMNNQSAFCEYISERTLKIKLFTQNIEALTLFTIIINGIMQPSNIYSGGVYYIMCDNDTVTNDIIEYGILNDIAPPNLDQSPKQLLVRDFIITNNNIRTETNYTYYLQNSLAIADNEFIYIDYSAKDYAKLVELKPPSLCSAYSELDESIIYATQCQSIGNRLIVTLQLAIPLDTLFILLVTGMTNQEQSSCTITRPIVQIISNDRTTVKMLATKNRANLPSFKFVTNPNIRYTYWRLEDSIIDLQYLLTSSDQIIRLNYNSLTLVPGQYSKLITLGQIDKPFNKILQFTLSSSAGSFKSISDLIVYPGDGKLITRLGCVGATNPQTYYLYFQQQEDAPIIYSEVGILQTSIVNQITDINTEFLTYNVQMEFYTIPILIDFTDCIPVEDLTILFELIPQNITDSPGLVFQSNSEATLSLSVNSENYKVTVIVQSTIVIDPLLPVHQAQLTMSFSGLSGAYYKQKTPTTIILVNNELPKQLLYSVQLEELSQFSYKELITFNSQTDAIIFYHCCLLKGLERNLSEVEQMIGINQGLMYSDYSQEQVGQIYVQAGVAYTLELHQLKARTWYKFKSWGRDYQDIENSSDYKEFVTQNNDGRLMKLQFNFGTVLTKDFKQSLVCWLCYSMAYPCKNVITFDAIYCKSGTQTNSTFNSTQIHTEYRQLQTNDTSTTTDIGSGEILVNNTVQVYFLPNQELPQDQNWKQVQEVSQNDQFLTHFVGNLTNTSILYSVDPLFEVISDTIPELISTIKFSRGITWLYISNMRLRDTGQIWGYIVPKFNGSNYADDSYSPTNIQIKYQANNLNQTVNESSFFILHFQKNQNPLGYNFTSLTQAKWYNIYLIITLDSPDLWTPTSSVYSYTNKTLRDSIPMPETVSNKIVLFTLIILLTI